MPEYDVIIAGAGSVGVPTAMALGAAGVKTLVVDAKPSPGQGDNKRAIGGIRATHSDPAKIMVGLRSLEIFSSWKETCGDDIEWLQGGYLFPVYRSDEERALKRLLPLQQRFGLKIDFIDANALQTIVPGISPDGLMGGTFRRTTDRPRPSYPPTPSPGRRSGMGRFSDSTNASTPCWWKTDASRDCGQTAEPIGLRWSLMRPAPIPHRCAGRPASTCL